MLFQRRHTTRCRVGLLSSGWPFSDTFSLPVPPQASHVLLLNWPLPSHLPHFIFGALLMNRMLQRFLLVSMLLCTSIKAGRRYLILVGLIVSSLTGCTTARTMALPGGGQGYAIGCGGIQHTMDDCLAHAAEICPGGYDIVTATQESVPLIHPYERSMYVRCKLNASSARASIETATTGEKTKEAAASCQQLYQDPHLKPLRGIIALGEPPTLEMQSNPHYVTDEQRASLDIFKSLNEKCRNGIAAANPRLWQIIVQVQPAPYEKLKQLYDHQITIGQYNTYREEILEKLNNAIAVQRSEKRGDVENRSETS